MVNTHYKSSCALMTRNSCRQKDLFKEGNRHNNVLNHLISPIIFSYEYLMFLLACQTNVVDFRSRTLNFAFVKSKHSWRPVMFHLPFQVRSTFLSSKNGRTCHASCPIGYTKQSHCMHAPIGTNFQQHFGTLSRVAVGVT